MVELKRTESFQLRKERWRGQNVPNTRVVLNEVGVQHESVARRRGGVPNKKIEPQKMKNCHCHRNFGIMRPQQIFRSFLYSVTCLSKGLIQRPETQQSPRDEERQDKVLRKRLKALG